MNVLGGLQNAHVEQLYATQVHGDYHVHAAQDKDLHELLQPIEDASHTRDRKRSPPDSACTRGTRVEVVEKVTTWAASDISTDPDEPHILWMHGYVGCGKSAISQEVCDKSDRQGRPVISFFFFRNEGDRSKIWRLATTLASQMATVIPETEPFIRAAVKANPALARPDKGGVSLVARMQRLLYMPFKASVAARGLAGGPFLIVLDGLDECDDKEQVQELIDDMLLFFEENPSIPLRVFITSRVEQHIQSHLDVPGVQLDNLVDHCSDDDIATFLEVLFENERRRNPVVRAYIRQHGEWPTASDKQKLVEHIGGSFIFASLLFRYIMGLTAGDDSGSPTTPMDRLPLTLNMNPGLDGLYAQTLARSEHLPHFLNIISTIALLRYPLPTSGIAELLGISTYEVVNVLVNLQAIIQVPGTDDIPVTVCHTSLRDFLTTESRSVRYYAHPRHHVHLFFRWVEIELEFHRRNLGELSSLVRGLPAVYRARGSMVHYLDLGSRHLKLSDWEFSAPLRRRVLELLPAASRDGAGALHGMTCLLAALFWKINVESLPSDLKKEGVGWYASFHPKPVPTGTVKRKKPFDVELAHTLGIPFLNHSDSGLISAKFSTDGKFLVVRCADRSAYICDTQTEMMTGTLVQDLPFSTWPLAIGPLALGPGGWFVTEGEGDDGIIRITESFGGHQESVSFLEFWPDGRLLISRSYDEKQRVWDVSSALGNPPSSSTTIRGDGIGSGDGAGMTDGAAKSTVLSLDQQAGDESEDPWDSDSDSLPRCIHISIAVSPDGRYVAASSDNSIPDISDGRYVGPSFSIQLWDLRQSCSSAGERQPLVPIERLNGHASMVNCLTFAKNGRFLVSASLDNAMRIWDVGHLGIAPAPESPSSSSSSPKGAGNTNPANNDRLVTGGRGKQKSQCTMRLVGQGHPHGAIAVSPDGRLVAGGAWTQGIMFWDLGLSSAEDSSSLHGESSTMNTAAVTRDMEAICRLERTTDGNRVEVKSVDLSPVGNMLAAAYADGQVMIWRYKFA